MGENIVRIRKLGALTQMSLIGRFNSLASTIFHHFIASDSGHESLQGLKRIHGLIPYFVLKGILKISNPIAMIRGEWKLVIVRCAIILNHSSSKVSWISSWLNLSAAGAYCNGMLPT
jgi:Domain of unknown function in PX-proteins (DUF3818)